MTNGHDAAVDSTETGGRATAPHFRRQPPFEEHAMMTTRLRITRLLLSATTLTLIGMLGAVQTVAATGPATVGLGTAAPFAVLAGTPKISSTGATIINGNLGISPAAAVTGFPPGIVHGTVHKADAIALQAQSDLTTAYTDAAGRPVTATHGTLGGLTLAAGVYTAGGVVLGLTGTLTLDGHNNPNSVGSSRRHPHSSPRRPAGSGSSTARARATCFGRSRARRRLDRAPPSSERSWPFRRSP